MTPSILLLSLTACAQLEGLLTEVRPPVTDVLLSGYVYSTPDPQTEADVLTAGGLTVEDPDGEPIAEGEAYDPVGFPGYWLVEVPAETELLLRLTPAAEEGLTTVWRLRSPGGDAVWDGATGPADLPGYALFTWPLALAQETFDAVATLAGAEPMDLEDPARCGLWGATADPEATDPSALTVTDAAGLAAPVVAVAVDPETGALSVATAPPVHYFFAFDLPVGAVDVALGEAETRFTCRGGELLTPWAFSGAGR
ncbi:MAG: hypothetical protein IPI35_31345 [Deltaproteobacteria bacterium]|nr:hypothetical protein [Deltaproteobacteria bacterium]